MKNRCVWNIAVAAALFLGISCSAYADTGQAGLFPTVRAGDLELVLKAIESGADLNARNADGLTPLMVAVDAGHVSVVRALLDKGADVNARICFYGMTALTLASRQGMDSEIARLLLQAGARRDVQDDRNGRPVVGTKLK